MEAEAYMSIIYVVKVQDGNEQFEYEFGNIPHATEFISTEKQPCTLWIADTVTGNETRIQVPK